MSIALRLPNAAAVLFGTMVLVAVASAQRTPWSHPDGTTHWYEAVSAQTPVTWDQAEQMARAAGGYLATTTSAAEFAFVAALVDAPRYWNDSGTETATGPWLGGVQTDPREPEKNWDWVTAEPRSPIEWAEQQPDDTSGTEDRLHLQRNRKGHVGIADAAASYRRPLAWVVEYSGASAPVTVGLTTPTSARTSPGYTLVSPRASDFTYLIDERGRVVHQWNRGREEGLPASYLLPNGDLLTTSDNENPAFPAPGGVRVRRFDWDSNLLWDYVISRPSLTLHHDVEPLPNGNILVIAWEAKSNGQALAAGRIPGSVGPTLWSEAIFEVQQTGATSGTIVWQWHVWDHLIQDYDPQAQNYGSVERHPERIDINYDTTNGNSDWLHFNSVAYNAALDQIVLSSRTNSEIWIIDHSTTTAEAATSSGGRWGKGGDLLYRWGNPAAYRGGTKNDQTLFFQHNAHWIPSSYPGGGNILIYNNGPRPGSQPFSTVDEITPPTDSFGNYVISGSRWGPGTPTWQYRAPTPTDFYSRIISGVQRLANGNTLVCEGTPGRLFEVSPTGQRVWEYRSPTGNSGAALQQGTATPPAWNFRALRYEPTYVGFRGRTLTPRGPIETYSEALLVDGSKRPHAARIGATVDHTIIAAVHPGRPFQLVSSLAGGPLIVDYRHVDVGVDPLLLASSSGGYPRVFVDYAGRLDANGRAAAKLMIPNTPGLAGLTVRSAFAVFDPSAPSGVALLSNTTVVDVMP